MKFRHVRAVAAAAVVLVALTGARHSHGGGCGSSHSSGSDGGSSSTGGSSTSGSSTSGGYEGGTGGYDGGTSSGSSTSGVTTGGSSTSGSTSGYTSGGSGSSRSAMRDIKINGCQYNGAGSVKTTVSATNSSSTSKYTYLLTVKFTAPGGKDLGTRHPSIPYVMPGRTDSTDVIQYVPSDAATAGTYRCSVTDVQRTPLS
ncbi:hypothetical protein [Streptomyces chrestomyceticus]|uniref:hypothetical protein n=1 Tax=Streptomyces chrestomyceticus TaxID=68185 RepID=UPI0033F47F9C